MTFQAGNWTLITCCYNPTNTAIYINNQLAAVGPGLPSLPAELAPWASLTIASVPDGYSPALGQVEEVCTFWGGNRVRPTAENPFGLNPAFDIKRYWSYLAPIAALGPIADATPGFGLQARASRITLAQDMVSVPFTLFTLTSPPPRAAWGFVVPDSTNGLQLITTNPLRGSFYSLQHAHWPPMPSDRLHFPPMPYAQFSNLNVYMFATNRFLVDDSGVTYPTPQPQGTNSSGPVPQAGRPRRQPGLEDSERRQRRRQCAFVGTTNGASYTLLSAEALTTNQTWMVEQDVTGAAGTNATLIKSPPLAGATFSSGRIAGRTAGRECSLLRFSASRAGW